MKTVISWVFTLLPLAIGLASLALVMGWIPVRGLESGTETQRRSFRKGFWFCAIWFTLIGIGCICQELGLLNELPRWAER